MLSRLKYLWIWLTRIRHILGFGVQSPADYSFICDVINQHHKYYQYDKLGRDDDWQKRKLGLLYFRIANWRQPVVIESDDYIDYLREGCHSATFGRSMEMVVVSLSKVADEDSLWEKYDRMADNGILIVEGIYNSKESMAIWKNLLTNIRSRVTFDLYYCGIILFDTKRCKADYIVNF